MNFSDVISAFEEAGVDIRECYWDTSCDLRLTLRIGKKRLVVAAVSLDGDEILVDIQPEKSK